MTIVALGELMATKVPSLNPALFPDEQFELWSIPAFDAGKPEKQLGSAIGSAKKVIQSGDVLLSRIVPHIRRAWVVTPNGDGFRQIGSGEWIVFRNKKFDPNYLRHFLISDPFHSQFMQTVAGVGGSLLRARPDGVAEIFLALPSLEEQKRIAAILDQADDLRRKRQHALTRLNQLGQAIFYEMFGDPAVNPRGFAVRNLRDFYISENEGTKCGPFGSALKKEEIVASGIPVWNMDNIGPSGNMLLPFRMWITDKKYIDVKSYSVTDGDVIISRAGTVGKMCVARVGNTRSIISTNLIRVRFGSNLLPVFFVALMTYCKGRVGRLKTGPDGSFTHMNTGVLDHLQFPYPPLALQQRFSVIANAIDQEKMLLSSHVSYLDSLFITLQHRAFRGKL